MNPLQQAGLVDILDIDSGFRLDIRYATANNFIGRAIYPVARCYLQEPVARQLARVLATLRQREMGLLIFDGYRPFHVQEIFFDRVPDENFIARPVRRAGRLVDGSNHSRGAAVDLTLTDASGQPLPMPSDFDAFGETAHCHYNGGDPLARRNRDLLQAVMQDHGFAPLLTEWWHFALDAERYPLLDLPLI